MSFRGRGRGRGYGRGGGSYGHQNAPNKPYILFPEPDLKGDVFKLPDLPNLPLPVEEQKLVTWKLQLERFWKNSCYHLDETVPKSKKQDAEIERYSDTQNKSKTAKRENLADYLKLISSNFPAELIQGSKRVKPDNKRLRWGRDADEKLDMFEKLEGELKENDENDDKEKKDGSEDEEEQAEVAEEESSDDDYDQNIEFDDDEDDMNMEEEAEEDYYE